MLVRVPRTHRNAGVAALIHAIKRTNIPRTIIRCNSSVKPPALGADALQKLQALTDKVATKHEASVAPKLNLVPTQKTGVAESAGNAAKATKLTPAPTPMPTKATTANAPPPPPPQRRLPPKRDPVIPVAGTTGNSTIDAMQAPKTTAPTPKDTPNKTPKKTPKDTATAPPPAATKTVKELAAERANAQQERASALRASLRARLQPDTKLQEQRGTRTGGKEEKGVAGELEQLLQLGKKEVKKEPTRYI